MRIATLAAAAFVAALYTNTPAFSQSSAPSPVSGPQGNLPGDTGSSSGGDGAGNAGPGNDGRYVQFKQSPVATGLDLKGRPQTEGPFAE